MSITKLSFIIPCLNEEKYIVETLQRLQKCRHHGHEIILSDGGSKDRTIEFAKPLIDQHIITSAGRAKQMNQGAKVANGNILCFLHADTLAPESIDEAILEFENKFSWGFFQIKLSGKHWQFRIIEWMINNRSQISQIASGDQGIFVTRTLFNKISGFSEMPLMEDIELSKRLKKISPPVCIRRTRLNTSSRRWEKHGIIRTVLLMWGLRLAYFLGTPTNTLAKAYSNHAQKK